MTEFERGRIAGRAYRLVEEVRDCTVDLHFDVNWNFSEEDAVQRVFNAMYEARADGFEKGRAVAADAERRALERICQLEDALRPFAIAGMVRGDKGDDDLTLNFIENGKTDPLIAIRWPDFTRAAEAMDDTPSPAAQPVKGEI